MSMFNMGGVKDAKVVSNNFLRAGIHNVIFKGIDKADGFNAIELRFEAVDGSGIHNERIFEPRSEERTQSQYGTNPSESEQFMCKIKQVIDALDPELAHKIEADGDKFAAPDFDFVDTKPIDFICQALEYHNFTPRRPIKENGQMSKEAGKVERQKLFQSDMALIDSCQMMLVVLLYNDPGTLIEIGVAAEKGMPVLVYDPYSIAENCMLTEIPNVVSTSADQIISELFKYASKL